MQLPVVEVVEDPVEITGDQHAAGEAEQQGQKVEGEDGAAALVLFGHKKQDDEK